MRRPFMLNLQSKSTFCLRRALLTWTPQQNTCMSNRGSLKLLRSGTKTTSDHLNIGSHLIYTTAAKRFSIKFAMIEGLPISQHAGQHLIQVKSSH